jgi:hypothetical protein
MTPPGPALDQGRTVGEPHASEPESRTYQPDVAPPNSVLAHKLTQGETSSAALQPDSESVSGGVALPIDPVRNGAGDTKDLAHVDEEGDGDGAAPPIPRISTGQPLDPPTRAFFEPLLGTDLGPVRVHTGDDAIARTRRSAARAVTNGHDIFFNAGQHDPAGTQGRFVLAHELMHVAQLQPAGPASASAAALEREANDGALALLQGDRPRIALAHGGQRDLGDPNESSGSDLKAQKAEASKVLDEMRAKPQSRGSMGAGWDYERFPEGPGRRWQPGDPPNLPDPRGRYPEWDTIRGRIWQNLADNEIKARKAGASRDTKSVLKLEPVQSLTDKQLKQMLDSGKGRADFEIEHRNIPQRVTRLLEEAGFSRNEARILGQLGDPTNLEPTPRAWHAVVDKAAAWWKSRNPTLDASIDERIEHPLGSMKPKEIERLLDAIKARRIDLDATPAGKRLRQELLKEKTLGGPPGRSGKSRRQPKRRQRRSRPRPRSHSPIPRRPRRSSPRRPRRPSPSPFEPNRSRCKLGRGSRTSRAARRCSRRIRSS